MSQLAAKFVALCCASLLVLSFPGKADALGLSGLGIKAGVNLTRTQQYSTLQGIGGQFDSHRWMLGSNLDLGTFILPKLHLTPGVDFIVQSNLRVYVINADAVYFFHQSPKGKGYAGAGVGTHLFRPDGTPGDTKISLNAPIGYQRKLGSGLAWVAEMKLVIADDERDSALQFSLGFVFGSQE